MRNLAYIIITVFCFYQTKTFAQLHTEPTCGQNFNLNWTTSRDSDDYYWPAGELTNTYSNVDDSGVDINITFTGETNTLGFWEGQTPKVGSKSSYLYKGIDLLTKGFTGTGITCTITFSKPIYALSFDIHHINVNNTNGDKYTITGQDTNGNTIFPKFKNSGQPTYTSDDNTGVVNAIKKASPGDNTIIGVNFSDSNYIKSISFLWEDCDTCDQNKPHATGLGNLSFCTPQTIDFDGVDDYIRSDAFLGGRPEVTMMTWIKLDKDSNGGDIMGQRNFRLEVDESKKLIASFKPNSGSEIKTTNVSGNTLKEEKWYHVALKFDGNKGLATLFLDGEIIWNREDAALIGKTISETNGWNAAHDFEIGRNSELDNNYFEGSIYETRVFNKALTPSQIHQQINQEIENNNEKIRGSVIPKDIDGVLWDDLLLYYKMNNVDTGYATDLSNNNRDGNLKNMTTLQVNQDFTAPLPYTTTETCDGSWTNKNNWLNGSVLNIDKNIPEHAIIQLKGNLDFYTNVSTTGLILEEGSTVKVYENSAFTNTWYLKLDGSIDLEGASRLIQTKNSTLDKTSSGIVEIDLQGSADMFTYNYWSSPVGKANSTSINNNYKLEDIFTNVDFLRTGYNGMKSPVSIADYWIWKFCNNLSDTYSSWQHVRSSGHITPGEGFTMKGPGTGAVKDKQNYILQGKPNNGDINLKVYAGNDYLIGNPYPSAIDAKKFIQDNKTSASGSGALSGTLYFWEHWGGGSHIASEYQGGYSTFSLSGSVPAISNSANAVIAEGFSSNLPDKYIPVGQGFYITAETDGDIRFNNEQRAFKDSPENTPTPSKESNDKSETIDSRFKLRLGFNSINNLKRQLLITVDEHASSNYDFGYDSKYIDTQVDDMYWLIDGKKCIIQGVNQINEQSIMPLGIHTKKDGFNSILIDGLAHTPANLNIYLHDKELNIYHDLKQSKYEIYLKAGDYQNRFQITFSEAKTLGTIENQSKQIEVYFSNEKNSIIINNPASKKIKSIEMYNVVGQALFKFNSNTNNSHVEYQANQIKPGNYILKIETEFGSISKKVLIR